MPSRKRDEKRAATPGSEAGGAASRLTITLIRSLIGLPPNHVRTLHALGLRRIRATVRHHDTPEIRGMLARVPYAVRVEEEQQA